jgi:hypothetical protein
MKIAALPSPEPYDNGWSPPAWLVYVRGVAASVMSLSRPGLWRLTAAAAAVAGALALPGLPVAASAAAQAAPLRFTVATLIIFAVRGGNAPTTPISPKGFPAP